MSPIAHHTSTDKSDEMRKQVSELAKQAKAAQQKGDNATLARLLTEIAEVTGQSGNHPYTTNSFRATASVLLKGSNEKAVEAKTTVSAHTALNGSQTTSQSKK